MGIVDWKSFKQEIAFMLMVVTRKIACCKYNVESTEKANDAIDGAIVNSAFNTAYEYEIRFCR